MNYHSVLSSAFAVATSLGYHPTLPQNLHRTLHTEGFPIAVIAPPTVLSDDGESEPQHSLRLLVKFLSKNVLDDADRAAAIATLATHAEQFCATLSSEPNIFSVTIGEIAPVGEVLTIAGEVAVSLSAEVRSLECNN